MHPTQVVQASAPGVAAYVIGGVIIIVILGFIGTRFARGSKAALQTFPGLPPRTAASPPPCPTPQPASDKTDYVLAPFGQLPGSPVSHKSITLQGDPSGASLELTQDLVLIADDFITIDRNIEWPYPTVAVEWDGKSKQPNLTMICVSGTITLNGLIGTNAKAEPCRARPGAEVSSSTLDTWIFGKDGQPGGSIYILANKVVINGVVQAQMGGISGNVQVTAPTTTAEDNFCAAFAGPAGSGGDLVICVAEGLSVSQFIFSGAGGEGGDAIAIGANGCDAYAMSGAGGPAGSIYLRSISQLVVGGPGTITASYGGQGGTASATGGNGTTAFRRRSSGGTGYAQGGVGELGGSVIFEKVSAVKAHGGPGGDGGRALANGGTGSPGTFVGWDGGDAKADGGNGASDGLPDPVFQDPAEHASHQGGHAAATTGAGGSGWATNGSTGQAYARGGQDYGAPLPQPDVIPVGTAPATATSP
jgi:hypothetical protein